MSATPVTAAPAATLPQVPPAAERTVPARAEVVNQGPSFGARAVTALKEGAKDTFYPSRALRSIANDGKEYGKSIARMAKDLKLSSFHMDPASQGVRYYVLGALSVVTYAVKLLAFALGFILRSAVELPILAVKVLCQAPAIALGAVGVAGALGLQAVTFGGASSALVHYLGQQEMSAMQQRNGRQLDLAHRAINARGFETISSEQANAAVDGILRQYEANIVAAQELAVAAETEVNVEAVRAPAREDVNGILNTIAASNLGLQVEDSKLAKLYQILAPAREAAPAAAAPAPATVVQTPARETAPAVEVIPAVEVRAPATVIAEQAPRPAAVDVPVTAPAPTATPAANVVIAAAAAGAAATAPNAFDALDTQHAADRDFLVAVLASRSIAVTRETDGSISQVYDAQGVGQATFTACAAAAAPAGDVAARIAEISNRIQAGLAAAPSEAEMNALDQTGQERIMGIGSRAGQVEQLLARLNTVASI